MEEGSRTGRCKMDTSAMSQLISSSSSHSHVAGAAAAAGDAATAASSVTSSIRNSSHELTPAMTPPSDYASPAMSPSNSTPRVAAASGAVSFTSQPPSSNASIVAPIPSVPAASSSSQPRFDFDSFAASGFTLNEFPPATSVVKPIPSPTAGSLPQPPTRLEAAAVVLPPSGSQSARVTTARKTASKPAPPKRGNCARCFRAIWIKSVPLSNDDFRLPNNTNNDLQHQPPMTTTGRVDTSTGEEEKMSGWMNDSPSSSRGSFTVAAFTAAISGPSTPVAAVPLNLAKPLVRPASASVGGRAAAVHRKAITAAVTASTQPNNNLSITAPATPTSSRLNNLCDRCSAVQNKPAPAAATLLTLSSPPITIPASPHPFYPQQQQQQQQLMLMSPVQQEMANTALVVQRFNQPLTDKQAKSKHTPALLTIPAATEFSSSSLIPLPPTAAVPLPLAGSNSIVAAYATNMASPTTKSFTNDMESIRDHRSLVLALAASEKHALCQSIELELLRRQVAEALNARDEALTKLDELRHALVELKEQQETERIDSRSIQLQLAEVRQNMQELEAEHERLNAEYRHLQQVFALMGKELEEIQIEHHRNMMEKRTQDAAYKQLLEEKATLQSELETLRPSHEQLVHEKEQWLVWKAHSEKEKYESLESITHYKTSYESEHDTRVAMEKKWNDTVTKHVQLQDEHNKLRKEFDIMQATKKTLQNEYDRLLNRCLHAEDALSSFQARYNALTQSIKQNHFAVDKQKTEWEIMDKNQKQLLEETQAKLEQQIRKGVEDASRSAQTIQSMQEELDQFREKERRIEEEKKVKLSVEEQLEVTKDKVEVQAGRIRSLQNEIILLEKQRDVLLSQSNAQKEALGQALNRHEQVSTELKETKRALAVTEGSLINMTASFERRQEAWVSREAVLNNRVYSLKLDVTNMKQEHAQDVAEQKKLTGEGRNLTVRLNTAVEKMAKLQQRYDRLSATHHDCIVMSNSVDSLRKKLAAADAKIQTLASKGQDSSHSLLQATAEAARLKSLYHKEIAERKELQSLQNANQNAIQSLEDKLRLATARSGDSKEEVEGEKSKLRSQLKENSRLKKTASDAQSEISRLKEELQEAQAEVARVRITEISALSQRIVQMDTQIQQDADKLKASEQRCLDTSKALAQKSRELQSLQVKVATRMKQEVLKRSEAAANGSSIDSSVVGLDDDDEEDEDAADADKNFKKLLKAKSESDKRVLSLQKQLSDSHASTSTLRDELDQAESRREKLQSEYRHLKESLEQMERETFESKNLQAILEEDMKKLEFEATNLRGESADAVRKCQTLEKLNEMLRLEYNNNLTKISWYDANYDTVSERLSALEDSESNSSEQLDKATEKIAKQSKLIEELTTKLRAMSSQRTQAHLSAVQQAQADLKAMNPEAHASAAEDDFSALDAPTPDIHFLYKNIRDQLDRAREHLKSQAESFEEKLKSIHKENSAALLEKDRLLLAIEEKMAQSASHHAEELHKAAERFSRYLWIGTAAHQLLQSIPPQLGFTFVNSQESIIKNGGLYVTEVEIDGNAESSGLRVGDIVEEVNDESMTSSEAFFPAVRLTLAGQGCSLRVRRVAKDGSGETHLKLSVLTSSIHHTPHQLQVLARNARAQEYHPEDEFLLSQMLASKGLKPPEQMAKLSRRASMRWGDEAVLNTNLVVSGAQFQTAVPGLGTPSGSPFTRSRRTSISGLDVDSIRRSRKNSISEYPPFPVSPLTPSVPTIAESSFQTPANPQPSARQPHMRGSSLAVPNTVK